MKVIDLLNKISNKEEVPKKIKVLFNVFEYDEDNYNYKNVDETLDNLFRHLGCYKGIVLNTEIEIIEDKPKEDKKIEKICLNTDYHMERKKYGALTNEEIVLDIQTLKKYIKEIMDNINLED